MSYLFIIMVYKKKKEDMGTMAIIFSDLSAQYQKQIIDQYKKQGKAIPPEILQALNESHAINDNQNKQNQRESIPNPANVNKYHNKPTKRAAKEKDISFQSSKEARRFDELILMFKGGVIRKLKVQPQFTLQESFITPEGKRVQAIRYTADFSYEQKRQTKEGEVWDLVVEDVKVLATRTPQYNMKRKMMFEKYGIAIKEI